MARPMTKVRIETGIPLSRVGDKRKFKDPVTKVLRDFIFVSEREVKDFDGFIIGVETIWQ